MRDYPLPQYALSIWLSGDKLMLGVPPRAGHDKPHTLVIPLERCGVELSQFGEPLASQRGWAALLHILKARRDDRSDEEGSLIGRPSEPVQYDLDEMLRAMKAQRYDSRGKKEVDLEELGL